MHLLINKPAGWTSFDAVNYIRKIARQTTGDKKIKVGHAGTLDPFATGLLIVGVGRTATKRLDEFKNRPKTYVATLHLGATSATGDPTGTIKQSDNLTRPTKKEIKLALKSFVGQQLQIPPMFSAKKINGLRLYKLARQGQEIKREPSQIEILDIKLLEYCWPKLIIAVVCSAGTYIRSLANDIGKKLGVGAYCEELQRTAIGPYKLADAQELSTLDFAPQNTLHYSLVTKP